MPRAFKSSPKQLQSQKFAAFCTEKELVVKRQLRQKEDETSSRKAREIPSRKEKESKQVGNKERVVLPIRPSMSSAKKYPSLLSVKVGLESRQEKERVCYNCMGKSHGFVDCVVASGRCGGDGHRTNDCSVVGVKTVRLEGTEGQRQRVL